MGSFPTCDAETTDQPLDVTSISYTVIREGLANILSPQDKEEIDSSQKQGGPIPQTVFYNPIQQFNRDLSVLAIRVFGDDLAAIRKARTLKASKCKKRKRGKNEDSNSSAGDGGTVETNGAAETGQDQINGHTATEFTRFRILDALSATGLRALRYAKEIPMTTSVVANDLSPKATESIQRNVSFNNLGEKVTALTGDARAHMYNVASPDTHLMYEVIDLDPYGTAATFFDSAVRAVVDGGLLCITCTDASLFASVGYPEKTYSQYGGLPFKGPQSHEAGLRLVLHAIATSAARYGLSIEPLLSLSIDYYIRLFVRIHRSPAEVKFLASKTMVVYNCDQGCGAWSTQFLSQIKSKKAITGDTIYHHSLAQAPSISQYCPHCDFKTHLSGPMWGGPIHNPHFIQRILDILPSLEKETYATIPRIEGMLSLALHESLLTLPTLASSPDTPIFTDSVPRSDSIPPIPRLNPSLRSNHPFFILPSSLAKILHCVAPPDAVIRGALANLGYRTSRSHIKPGSICTDATWSVIWEIMREWVRQKSPLKDEAIKKGTAGWGIMSRVGPKWR